MTVAAKRAELGWIVGATFGQRHFVVDLYRHGYPGALYARSAGRRRLSPESASPYSGQFGRAFPGGLRPRAKALSWASVERRCNSAK